MIQIKIEVTCRIIMEVIYLAVKLFKEFFPLRKYLSKSLQFMYTISGKPFMSKFYMKNISVQLYNKKNYRKSHIHLNYIDLKGDKSWNH